MLINEIKVKSSRGKKRIGRGGKRGTYSGRGLKGQKSRSGHRILPAERVLIQRLPKLRGYKNRNTDRERLVLNVGDLGRLGVKKITLDLLRERKLVNKGFRGEVKILGRGEITAPIEVSGLAVSKSAVAKITAAGGSIVATPPTS